MTSGRVPGERSSLLLREQVDLDIEDLTEAISSNAFDIPTSPTVETGEARPRDRTYSLPPIPPSDLTDGASISSAGTTPSVQSAPAPSVHTSQSTIKPSRGRHTSLSARFFGSLSGSTILPAASDDDAEPTPLPKDTAEPLAKESSSFDPGLTPNIAQRNGRSGSIRSVSSARSTSSKVSDGGSDSSRKGGYSDWFGWKGWNAGAKASTSLTVGVSPDEVPEEDAEEEEAEEEEADARSTSKEGADELATPMPDRSSGFFSNLDDRSPSTPAAGRERALSDVARTLDEASSPPHTSSGQSSSSRRTSTTRSTYPSTIEDPSPSVPDALSPAIASTPEGKRSPSGASPPDSPSTSRTRSPAPPPPSLATRQAIATPALSTPMTTSTLSTPSLVSPRRPLPSDTSPQHSQLFEKNGANLDAQSASVGTARGDFSFAGIPDVSQGGTKADEGAADGQTTLKGRKARIGSVPANFVPGVPIYSASSEGAGLRGSSSDQGYVAAAKGTIGRALGLGLASSEVSPASTGMTRSSSDGVRRGLNDALTSARQPSLSLSRYALFAQPAVSTPVTSVSLVANSSPSVVHAITFAPPPPSGTPTTMELDTISVEAAPPSLALLKPNPTSTPGEPVATAEDPNEDGPLVDRYGFIYDVHSGMELLKENRRREQEKETQSGKGNNRRKARLDAKKAEEAQPLERDPSGIATPTQLEVHPQLDAIREAMGLTPTNEAPNAFSPLVETKSLDLDVPPSETPLRPPKLVRAPASDDSCLSRLSGPQSMRALLSQLRNMSDTIERTQQAEWDAFIRKRQAKLAKLKKQQQQQLNALHEGSTSGKTKGKTKKERPRTMWGANALAEEKIEDSDSTREEGWTENLVGVAQMGTEGKSKKEDWNEFKELVRKGIPITYRPKSVRLRPSV